MLENNNNKKKHFDKDNFNNSLVILHFNFYLYFLKKNCPAICMNLKASGVKGDSEPWTDFRLPTDCFDLIRNLLKHKNIVD